MEMIVTRIDILEKVIDDISTDIFDILLKTERQKRIFVGRQTIIKQKVLHTILKNLLLKIF